MKAQPLLSNSLPANFIDMQMKDPLHFVIIDDDSINNMVCRAAIKSATGGELAVCFNNPQEGLKYFENEYSAKPTNPILLFLDINMPEMNGWEWLEKYSSFPQSIKDKVTIYILSSSVNPTDIDQAHSNSLVKDYIVKPLTKAKVMNLLEHSDSNPMLGLKMD